MKIAKVVWQDTVSSGDHWVEDIHEPATIISCGMVYKETEEFICLVLSLSEDKLIRGFISIPRVNIVQLIYLAEC